MRVNRMTATFGKLEGETLTLKPGLNIITAPNEGGKSTWCAFLRAMLYGIPTRERDTRTTIAEKNRYAPWSGVPMAGEIDITWKGRDITLRRFAKGASPFGGFEAVDTHTGAPIDGLTADNCGETLLGVGRETYQRSAFVGQSGVPIDGDPELEKRIAALVSSGEEDVSFSETEKALKGWLNRRKHNKTGILPKLEAELAEIGEKVFQMKHFTRQIAELESRRDELDRRRGELERESAAQKARRDWALREQYDTAVADLQAARAERAGLEQEAGPLPPKEELRQAQGDLAYFNTLNANIKLAEQELASAQEAARAAKEAAFDPAFEGMTPDEACRKADEDVARAAKFPNTRRHTVGGILSLVAAVCFALGALGGRNVLLWAAAGAALIAGISTLVVSRRRSREHDALWRETVARYGVQSLDHIRPLADAYRERWTAAEDAGRRAEHLEESLRGLTEQRDGLWDRLLDFTHGFAPAATDAFGVSAALSRALSLDERRATAQVRLEAAQRLVASIPYTPAAEPVIASQSADWRGNPSPSEPPPPVSRSATETAALLAAVTGELSRTDQELAALRGRRSALGDPAELEARRDQMEEERLRRQGEYDALALALETLGEANGDLQARFSPDLNRRAGEIFAALTGGKYEGLTITREFEAAVRETGGVLPRRALSLSRGAVDQLYLAVRLAVCDLALPAEDPAPLVLDDALADFDDARMALALDYLNALPRQVLLFTCHSREGAHCPACILP